MALFAVTAKLKKAHGKIKSFLSLTLLFFALSSTTPTYSVGYFYYFEYNRQNWYVDLRTLRTRIQIFNSQNIFQTRPSGNCISPQINRYEHAKRSRGLFAYCVMGFSISVFPKQPLVAFAVHEHDQGNGNQNGWKEEEETTCDYGDQNAQCPRQHFHVLSPMRHSARSRLTIPFFAGTPLDTALEFLKLIWGQSRLAQNTPQYANWNLTVMWNNRCTHLIIAVSNKLYMTASLADYCESCLFQLTLDLTIGKGFKRH